MVTELEELMSQHNLVNEAELFCSDMQFRRHTRKKGGMMIGDESKKDEDILMHVSQCLNDITKRYRDKLAKIDGNEDHKALGVYIASYYNHRNEEMRDAFAKLKKTNEHFLKFHKDKKELYEKRNESTVPLNLFDDYKRAIEKSEEYGSKQKLA